MSHLRRFFRRHFTRGGRVLLGAALVSAPAILNPGQTHLDVVLMVALSLIVVGLAAGLLFRRKLGGSWELPTRVSCGESPTLTVELRNLSSRPAYELDAILEVVTPGVELPEEPAIRLRVIEPGESAQLSLQLRTSKRGAYTLGPLYAGTTFPFGISRLGTQIGKQRRLLVTPRVHPIHRMAIDPGGHFQPGAVPVSLQTGESTEFIGVREYRPGDSLRKIHWKLLARRGMPVVREFSREYFSRLGLILDTYRPPQSEHFELATEVAASMANYLSQKDAVVDFFGEGSTLYPVSLGNQSALTAILDLLACVEPCRESPYELLEAQAQHRLQGLSSVIFITFDLCEERLAFIQALRSVGAPVRVYSVSQGESDSEVTYLDPADIPGCLEVL